MSANGAPSKHIGASRSEARRVSRAVSTPWGYEVSVRSMISVVDAAKLTVKSADPPVLVLEDEQLDGMLSGLTPTLLTDQYEREAVALLAELPEDPLID
jgi:hypothetical protein